MRTAEEILKEYGHWGKPELIKGINEARIEAIKECAEVAKLEYRVYHIDGGYSSGTDMGQEIQIEEPNEYIGINKQSILKLLDQIK